MSSQYGKHITFEIFGQSHSECIGVIIRGLPRGETLDAQKLQAFCDLRAPGRNELSTPRKEPDQNKNNTH